MFSHLVDPFAYCVIIWSFCHCRKRLHRSIHRKCIHRIKFHNIMITCSELGEVWKLRPRNDRSHLLKQGISKKITTKKSDTIKNSTRKKRHATRTKRQTVNRNRFNHTSSASVLFMKIEWFDENGMKNFKCYLHMEMIHCIYRITKNGKWSEFRFIKSIVLF